MKIRITFAGVARALRATSAGLAVSFLHTALVTAAGLVLNWGFIALAARAVARDSTQAEAALATLPVPMSLGFLVLLLGLLVPAVYFLLGQRLGAARATRRIYAEYRDDVVAALTRAWDRARAQLGAADPDRRALREIVESWNELSAPVRFGLGRLVSVPQVRAALATAGEEARERGDAPDSALALAVVEKRISEAILTPSWGPLWLLLAANTALLVAIARLLGFW